MCHEEVWAEARSVESSSPWQGKATRLSLLRPGDKCLAATLEPSPAEKSAEHVRLQKGDAGMGPRDPLLCDRDTTEELTSPLGPD